MMTFALFIFGPSNILGLPANFYVMMVGYGMLGFAEGFLFAPILPEIIDSYYITSGLTEGKDEYLDGVISDQAAGVYGSALAIGLICAPLTGSFVYQLMDRKLPMTADVFAIACGIWTIIYGIFNVLIDIKKDREDKNNLE